MQRMGMVIGLKPREDRRIQAAACRRLAGGARLISGCNIRNYSIFLKEPENLLFGYWNITGRISRPTWRRWRPIRRTQEWWAVCMPCQEPLETRKEGEWWAMMEEVFHLD